MDEQKIHLKSNLQSAWNQYDVMETFGPPCIIRQCVSQDGGDYNIRPVELWTRAERWRQYQRIGHV